MVVALAGVLLGGEGRGSGRVSKLARLRACAVCCLVIRVPINCLRCLRMCLMATVLGVCMAWLASVQTATGNRGDSS